MMPDSSQQGPDLAPGRKLGNYTIVRKIGEGGMGAVYEAHQAGINRRVALKVLPKALRQNQVFLERFLSHLEVVWVVVGHQDYRWLRESTHEALSPLG